MLRLTLILIALTQLAGCGQFNHEYDPAAIPSGNTGFIYGNLHLEDNATVGSKMHIGFEIHSVDEKVRKSVELLSDRSLAVHEFPPGQYYIKAVLFAMTLDGGTEKRPASGPFLGVIDVKANEMTYIGAVFGSASASVERQVLHYNWKLDQVGDAFDADTATLVRDYPNLAGLPKHKAGLAFLAPPVAGTPPAP